jgi:folate-dependent phosphoribosylglycinamide formyltransferase PurN
MKKLKIAVLASGGGTNLQALIDEQKRLADESPYEIACVILDRAHTGAEARAKEAGIPVRTILLSSLFPQADHASISSEQKRTARSDAVLALC